MCLLKHWADDNFIGKSLKNMILSCSVETECKAKFVIKAVLVDYANEVGSHFS